MARNKEIILGVCASIAIYKACEVVRRLRDKNCSVTVVMTREAEELIKPSMFSHLSGNKVYTNMFEEALPWDIEHVSLAEKADVVLVAPATANIIGKISSGISDDLLTCLICATSAPVLLAPAMNEKMYLNKITQGNILKLRSLGYRFIEPTKGKLACGKVGVGCLADVDRIVQEAIALRK